MGLNPIEKSSPPVLELTFESGESMDLRFFRASERADLDYFYEGSSSLKEWLPLVVASTSVEPNGEVGERVAVEFDWSLEPNFPRFVRIGIKRVEGE